MRSEKKYFGMTGMQIGILGGLAGAALLIFCLLGVLVMRNRLTPAAQLPTLAPTLEPSPTLIIAATPTSTPAATPQAYESLIPGGWVQYRTALYELWLPSGYKNGKTDTLITGLGTASIMDLSLTGKYVPKSANKIYVNVSYEPLSTTDLDALITTRLSELGPYLSLSDRSRTDINTVPAVRLMFSGRKGNNVDINELTYVVLDGTTVWYIQYTAEITEFYEMLPTFEASAQTFRVVK